MVAMRAVNMAVVRMVVIVVMVAIRAVHVSFVIHGSRYSGMKSPGIISPFVEMCTRRPSISPVFSSPSRR